MLALVLVCLEYVALELLGVVLARSGLRPLRYAGGRKYMCSRRYLDTERRRNGARLRAHIRRIDSS